MNWLWFIIIGAVAGWLAGKIMRGGGFGLLINLVIGIVGGVIGGWFSDCWALAPTVALSEVSLRRW